MVQYAIFPRVGRGMRSKAIKNGDLCENFIHVPSTTDYKSSLDNIVAIILFSIVY